MAIDKTKTFQANAMKFKENTIVFLLFFITTCTATFPLILHMNSSIYGPFFTTDIRGAVWNHWWLQQSIVQHADYFRCPYIAAPFGVDTTHAPHSVVLLGIISFLSHFMSPVFLLNFMTLLSFALTGLFSYYLILYLCSEKLAAFLCALALTFSPYHLNKVMEFTYVFLANWLILYIYFLLKLKEKFTWLHFGWAACALALTLAFNFYYGFFALIFTLWFLFFCFAYQWKTNLNRDRWAKNIRLFSNVICLWLTAVLLNLSTFFNIASVLLSPQRYTLEKSAEGFSRSFSYLYAQSARPLSYLLPASSHPVFGRATEGMFGSIFYGRGAIEQTLYVGWIPLLFAYYAFRQWRKKRSSPSGQSSYFSTPENFTIGFFIFSAVMAFIFSMPPFINLGVVRIPLPGYFIYTIAPMFRAYARLGVLAMLSVSVLAAYGISYLFKNLRNRKQKMLCFALILVCIAFEFTNIPPWRATQITENIPEVYRWLKNEPGDIIVAEYPIMLGKAGEAQENYDYLFYQTFHHKRLANGAVAGTRPFEIKEKFRKISDPSTPDLLRSLGVRYIILHSDLYEKGIDPNSVDVIGALPQLDGIKGYRLVKTFGNDIVYEVTASQGGVNQSCRE